MLLNDKGVAKIADFGMSREAVGKDYYTNKGGQLPLRWTAPECLEEHKFSEQSDVWSFGILLYELWTKAETPYVGWRNEKVWVQVLGGYRLPCPKKCPQYVHDLMMECWRDVGERLPFAKIDEKLFELQKVASQKQVYNGTMQPGQNITEQKTTNFSLSYMTPDVDGNTQSNAGAKSLEASDPPSKSPNPESGGYIESPGIKQVAQNEKHLKTTEQLSPSMITDRYRKVGIHNASAASSNKAPPSVPRKSSDMKPSAPSKDGIKRSEAELTAVTSYIQVEEVPKESADSYIVALDSDKGTFVDITLFRIQFQFHYSKVMHL